MFFLPPQEFWYLTVTRLSVSFDDNKAGIGTGFFVIHNDQYFLITARHVVDAKYLMSTKRGSAICTSVNLSFQSAINSGTPDATFGYKIVRVSEPEFSYAEDEVDLAVLKIPREKLPIIAGKNVIRPCAFPFSFLAAEDDLSLRYAGEPVVFLGFPDNSPMNKIGSAELHYPILRQGVFAYPPIHGIPINGELGRNYGLIDSYAQSGFSGGPIISLQKGWSDGSWHPKEEYRPPKVVGLICGHYRSVQDRADGGHAGLSFFARSNSIVNLITAIA